MLRTIKLGLLLTAVLLLAGFSGCLQTNTETANQTTTPENNQPSTQTPETGPSLSGENLLTIDPNTQTVEIKEGFDQAQDKAKEWQNSAQLVAIQVEIPGSLKKNYVSTRYFFSSVNVDHYYWTIALTSNNDNYVRALIPKEDYSGIDLKPVVTRYNKYNYIEALQIAEQNGGEAWRQTHNLGGVTLVLSRGQPKGWLYWQIEYLAVDKNGERLPTENFKLKFNSYSGEVVGE